MILNKWWLMVVQGILLFVLSFLLFIRAQDVITTSKNIIAIIAFISGVIAVFGYFFSNPSEKDIVELISGAFSCVAGIFFLLGGIQAEGLVTWLYGGLMAINAYIIVHTSWYLRSEITWWWLSVVVMGYTLIIVFPFSNESTFLNIPMALFAGIQFFITGLFWLLLAFVVRKLEQEYSKTIREIIDHQKQDHF